MPPFTLKQTADPSARRGIAPLEFVMALPVLLLLMVAITWLGFSVIGQTEALVEARNKAWKRRFEDIAKKPLIFPFLPDTPLLYSHAADYVTETVTKPVNVSPVFKAAPPPSATHTILAGSWDHRAMDMNSPPNIELYLRASANSATKDIQSKLGSLKNLANSVAQTGASAILQAFTQGSNVDAVNDQAKAEGNSGEAATDQKKKADKAALQRRLQEIGAFVNPLNDQVQPVGGGELNKTIDEIDRLEAERIVKEKTAPVNDAEKEKQRLAELERLDRKIDLLKGKRQRLESEARDIIQELNSFPNE